MTNAETFRTWAPGDSLWSAWAKPVLFAENAAVPEGASAEPGWRALDVAWAPPTTGHVALVLDLPGEQSVLLGLALAERGYRPVPLYNCAPGPSPIVNVAEIQRGLFLGATDLAALSLPPDAPPAFLLDSLRNTSGAPGPGRFDNRWAVFPQDFPSANLLLSRGISRALLVQDSVGKPASDLAHVLLRWQEARLATLAYGLNPGGPAKAITVSRPSRFRRLWYRASVLAGLRRHRAGGFGALIPEQPGRGKG